MDAQDVVDIHEPEYDDPKEPYAFFGLAAYYAQCFEKSFVLLITTAEAIQASGVIQKKRLSLDEMFSKFDRETLGRLIQHASKLTKFDPDLAQNFLDLLQKRNYLMHHFFYKNSFHMITYVGRRKILDELRLLAQAFQKADRALRKIYEPLWRRIGMTDEMMQKAYDELLLYPDAA